MFEKIKQHIKLRRLLQLRRQNEAFYAKEFKAAAKDYDEQSQIIAIRSQEIGFLDDEIQFLLSQQLQEKADHLQIPTPPFSKKGGKWVEGEYTGKWRLSIGQIHKLRSTIRKEEKERWEIWQSHLTLLIGFGGVLIGLVSVLKK